MKIAFIGQKGIPAKIGGVERHVEELAIRMAQRGHQVFVYVRNHYTDTKLTEYKGVKLIHLPSIATKNLDAITHTFISIIHALFQGFDVIHFHSIGPSSLSFLARIFGGKTKIVATYHCQDYYHQKWSWFGRKYLQFGEWMTCKAPHKTITVSKILSSLVKNEFGTDPVYIPNGYCIRNAQTTETLSEWNLDPNGYILSISRLIRHKGIHHLIEAFKILERKGLHKGKKLVIVGDGFYTDNYVKFLKKLSAQSQNIIFTGALNGEKLAQVFQNAYLFVQPSQSEGLSITLLEAMGYGKGVLVSDIPENMEAISQTGFIFENGNVEDLALKLKDLIENEAVVIEEGKKSKTMVESKYDWKSIVEKIDKLYLDLIQIRKTDETNS